MTKIYPKTCSNLRGIRTLKKYVDTYQGIEIQMIDFNKKRLEFNIIEPVESTMLLFPNIKEIVIHLPLDFCNISYFVMKGIDFITPLLEDAKKMSNENDISICLLFHIYDDVDIVKLTMLPFLNKMLDIIKGYNITILLENVYMVETEKCTVSNLEVCKFMGNKQLKACIDICHIHSYCNIFKKDINLFMKEKYKIKDCEKYIKQMHFSAAINNDGYKDYQTHSRKHETRLELTQDAELLSKYGMRNKIFVIEICEDDYNTRKDQIEEIETLEDVMKII